jgi:hypothetical protein
VPIVAAAVVSDDALQGVWSILEAMLAKRPEVIEPLQRARVRFGIIGAKQQTLDMPEYADLQTAFPNTDWNARARGLGATIQRPLSSVGEENVLCLAGDRYRGESIAVHEFSHTIADLGVVAVEPTFKDRLAEAYKKAVVAGTWKQTYAATDPNEYWAEGVQDWFNTNARSTPPNGIHGAVSTRVELQAADPALAGLVAEVFAASDFTPRCPDGRPVTPPP